MKIFSVICLALVLAACGDPHDTKVPTDISKWSATVKPSLQKLTPEERFLFSQFAIRHIAEAANANTGNKTDPIPENMTIGKAIEEQRNYVARHQPKEPEEETRKDKSKQ